jgi:hypothetical protein
VPKSFKEWIQEGEELYSTAMQEFQAIVNQLQELETRLSTKVEEVNQIASMIGKPPVEAPQHTPAVQIVEKSAPGSIPASRNTIAKALTGRGLG